MNITPTDLAARLRENPDLAAANRQMLEPQPVTPVTVQGDSEHDAQVAVFQWIDANMDRYPALRTAFAVPNGGHRFAATAGKLKREGVRAGVPDMFVLSPRAHAGNLYHGLAIELKVGKNKPTEAQVRWISDLRYFGYMAIVCWGAQAAIDTIKHYLEIDE